MKFFKNQTLIPFFILGTVVVQILLLFLSIIILGKINTPVSILAELNDGSAARVTPLPPNQRSPVVIQSFVRRSLTNLLSWRISPQNPDLAATPQLDKGVKTETGRITSNTFQAGFALSEDFRSTFLNQIAKLTPESVFEAKTQSILVIQHLSQPQKIAESRWKLNMVANLLIFKGGRGVGKPTTFNKTIFVRSVDIPSIPGKQSSQLEKQMYKARREGLEIYLMENLK
jgi:hypothetical protein